MFGDETSPDESREAAGAAGRMGDEVVEASCEGAAVLEAEAAARGADEAAAAAATPGAAFAIELGSEGAVW